MKQVLSAFLVLSLLACQKENDAPERPPVVEPAPVPPMVCKVASIREYPAVDGKSVVRTFVYDAAKRIIRMDIQNGSNPVISKNITYNTNNKIDKLTNSTGEYELFTYTNGVVTGYEAFDAAGNPLLKHAFAYEGGKMVRESRYEYNAANKTYVLKDYLVYEWDANGNIATVKTYSATDVVKITDAYTYYTDKLNKQQTVTPQLELLLMNWSNDITAFMNSPYLMKEVTNRKLNLVYETNEWGSVTSIKTDSKDNLFTFTYGCSN